MPLEVKHTNHKDYLDVVIMGTRSPQLEYEESSIIWRKIFELCAKYQQDKLLVQSNIKGRMPLRSRINYAFTMEEMGLQEHYKIAGVALNSQVDHDMKIVEQFANNIGYHVKVFVNEADALIWLLTD
ncbi:MAG: hypothetical protein OEQ81_08465 [Flavobacteriaceae bacterium]|nr:hypothetical protein [Flavobacteriaceae bacterium]